jgi:hypothetical protein
MADRMSTRTLAEKFREKPLNMLRETNKKWPIE